LVVPLTGTTQRDVAIQVESGRTRQFQWNDSIGYYPANSKTRIVTSAAKTLQILWRTDGPCWNAVEGRLIADLEPDGSNVYYRYLFPGPTGLALK
jgi:hypothetical protein